MIYRAQYKGNYTGWDYRIDVIPAGTGYIDYETETVYELPFECIKLTEGDRGFDKITIGLEKVPYLEFEVDLNKVPLMSVYDDFETAVLNPNETLVATAIDDDYFHCTTFDIETGTIWRVFVKKNFEIAEPEFEQMGTFIQIATSSNEDDYKKDKKKIRAEHWAKIAIDNLDYSRFDSVTPEKTASGCFEYIHLDGSFLTSAGHTFNSANADYFGFISRDSFNNWLNAQLTDFAKRICRESGKVFSYGPSYCQYFEQSYNGTGNIPEPIASLEGGGYYLATIIKDGIVQGGWFDVHRRKGSFFGDFPGLFEYFTELYDDGLTKAEFCERGIKSSPISNNYAGEFAVDVSMVHEQELILRDAFCKVGNVRASISDAVGDDLQSWESKSRFGTKEANYSVPVIYSNLPSALSYGGYIDTYQTALNLKSGVTYLPFTDEFSGKFSDLYYFENDASIFLDTEKGGFVKVHKYAKYLLKESPYKYSEDLKLFSKPDNKYTKFMFDYQLDQNKLQIACDTVLALFNRQDKEVEISIPFYRLHQLIPAHSNEYTGFDGCYTGFRLLLDLTAWRAKYAGLPEAWSIVSIKSDFESEVYKLLLTPEID